MSLLEKTLTIFSRRAIEWTGILQRIFREFVTAAEADLSEKELDSLYALPELVVDLAQAGVLEAVEIKAGSDGLFIKLSPDPNETDELDLSKLPLCDFSGRQVTIGLVVNDMSLSYSLGLRRIQRLSSRRLQVSVKTSDTENNSSVGSKTSEVKVWRVSR